LRGQPLESEGFPIAHLPAVAEEDQRRLVGSEDGDVERGARAVVGVAERVRPGLGVGGGEQGRGDELDHRIRSRVIHNRARKIAVRGGPVDPAPECLLPRVGAIPPRPTNPP
jgi:hypothetical protein